MGKARILTRGRAWLDTISTRDIYTFALVFGFMMGGHYCIVLSGSQLLLHHTIETTLLFAWLGNWLVKAVQPAQSSGPVAGADQPAA